MKSIGGRSHDTGTEKVYLNLTRADYLWPLAFMLSATMVGLNFPPGYLLLPVVLINRFLKDRYDFIIQLTLFMGGYQLFHFTDIFLPLDKLVFLSSVAFIVFFRKNRFMKKICMLLLLYAIGLLIFMMMSDETLAIQFTGAIAWMGFTVFIFPLAAFSGRSFDIMVFFRKLFPYLFIFCIFYVLDGILLGDNIFMPRDVSAQWYGYTNTFMSIHPSFFGFKRIWPVGLYMLILCIYPIVRYYRLTKVEWALIILALIVTRTSTFMAGIMLAYVLLQPQKKKIVRYAGLSMLVLVALYFVDTNETVNEDGVATSTLRIRSTVQQFIDLGSMEDEEDLAKFGTTRMAQIIPKWQLLYELDRQWIGFGFLSRDKTTMTKYIIDNELYSNPEDAEEVATGVEVVPVQIILTVGFLGLIMHLLFLWGLWLTERRLKYKGFFASVAFTFMFIGIAGMSGLVQAHGLYMSALAYGAVVLANRRELGGFALPQLKPTK